MAKCSGGKKAVAVKVAKANNTWGLYIPTNKTNRGI